MAENTKLKKLHHQPQHLLELDIESYSTYFRSLK